MSEIKNPNSRHHYTRNELFEMQQANDRTSGEFTNIQAPKSLKGNLKKEFYDTAYKLLSYGMSELDEFMLASFLESKELYLYYVEQQKAVMKSKPTNKWQTIANIEDKDLKELIVDIVEKARAGDSQYYQQLADKQFKQCLACANALGLTISSRCKLIIPKSENNEEL